MVSISLFEAWGGAVALLGAAVNSLTPSYRPVFHMPQLHLSLDHIQMNSFSPILAVTNIVILQYLLLVVVLLPFITWGLN